MNLKKIIVLQIVAALIILSITLPLIFGQYYRGGYAGSPLDYFENEWVMFIIIFLIFFGVIFWTINRSFNNAAVSATVGAGLALLISITLMQRGLLYNYVGEGIGPWILIAVVLIAFAFLARFLYENFGNAGVAGALIGIWILLYSMRNQIYEVLPYSLLTDEFLTIYEIAAGWFGLVIVLIACVIIISLKQDRTIGDGISKLFNKKIRR